MLSYCRKNSSIHHFLLPLPLYPHRGGLGVIYGSPCIAYDAEGERLHTTYIGAAPDYGKHTVLTRLTREIRHIKKLYPDALYIGIADGAADNWTFLGNGSGFANTLFII